MRDIPRDMRGAPRTVNQRKIHAALELRKQGMKQDAIAVELGIAQGTVSVILRRNGLGGHLVKWTK